MLGNLIAEMARNGIEPSDIAACLGCSERTAKNKINEITPFTYFEVVKIQNAYFPKLSKEYLMEKTDTGPEKVG